MDAISEEGRAELRRLHVLPVRVDAINEQGRASWAQCSISKGGCSRAELPGQFVLNVRADATSKGRASWAICSTSEAGCYQ